MRTLVFGQEVVDKERGPYIFVEWSCANKRNKSLRTLFFGQMVVYKERNETGSCAYKRNKLMMTLIFGQMLVHKERINERGSLFLSNETVVHKRKNK